jgi:hypothetical protein
MQIKVSFRRMSGSPELEALVHAWAARLQAVYARVHRCEVVIEAPHRRRRHGDPCSVRVSLGVPGGRLDIRHEPVSGADTDIPLAVRDAFRAARRRLEDHVRRALRHEVKAGAPSAA